MSNATQHFTDGYAASFPSKDGNNSYSSTALTKNLIRKSVEHAGWLIDMKKKDILQLIDDKIQLEGADQISDDKLVIIVAKYGAARGGMHNTDLAGERIDQRIESIRFEPGLLGVTPPPDHGERDQRQQIAGHQRASAPAAQHR